jgi:hypothetical protein
MRKLLLLDADIVIDIHTLDLFDKLKSSYEVCITKKVFEEAKYYKKGGLKYRIDLKDKVTLIEDIEIENLRIVNREAREAMLQIDPGEATSIAYLNQTSEKILFCLCDKAAIKLVAYMNLNEKCISLENLLKRAGHHGIKLYPRHFESNFKDCIKDGKALRVLYKLKT